MTTIFSVAWVKGAAERAIKTGAQTLVASFGASAAGVVDVDWASALSITALAMLASILTSVGNADFTAGDNGTPVAASLDLEPDDQEIAEDEPDDELEVEQTGIDPDVTIEDDTYPETEDTDLLEDEEEDAGQDDTGTDHADSDDPDAAARRVKADPQ